MAYLGAMPTLDPIPELKIILAKRLIDRLDGWSQEAAGELLRADQPRASNLRNQRLDRFSLDRMVRFVAALGGEVSLEVTWTRHGFIGRLGEGPRAARPHSRIRAAPRSR
jgi:predicted XRE-type DNA-binding protein